MLIKDSKGHLLDDLPETGKCRVSETSPLRMERCPAVNFDDEGMICIPELCFEYWEPKTK